MIQVGNMGASGFVGSRLIEIFHLEQVAKVVPIIRSSNSLAGLARFSLDWRVADALDEKALVRAFRGCDVVVHSVHGPNDLIVLDLRADRVHPRKRLRPFAAGDIPISRGAALFILLFAAGITCGAVLSWQFLAVLLAYAATSTAYSLYLKISNVKSLAVLDYKQKDLSGEPAPPPQRNQPEMPPEGAMAMAMAFSDDLRMVTGGTDPHGPEEGPDMSRVHQQRRAGVGENANYHDYDNLMRSVKHTGRIILDWIPEVYDTQRVIRIIGGDGTPDRVTINQKATDDQGVAKVLNDVTVGEYDVVMDTGPGYATKRLEALDLLSEISAQWPELKQIAGDLIVRLMEFDGADVIADRLAAQNPLAQIDDKSDVPPRVQMQIKQLQQQNMAQELELKTKKGIADAKNQTDITRGHIAAAVDAHDVETRKEIEQMWDQSDKYKAQQSDETKEQIANAKNATDLRIAHLEGLVAMLLQNGQQDREAKERALQ
jgi:hypothetical protein